MTRAIFQAVLPLPPSVNNSLRPGESGVGLKKTPEARGFEKACRALVRHLQPPLALHRGPLEIYLVVYVSSIASDGGNRLKLIEDALTGLAFHDDRQIVEWHVTKRVDAERPRVDLRLEHADAAAHQEIAQRLARAERDLGPPAYYEPREKRAQARAAKRQAGLRLSPAYRPPKP